MKRMVAVLLFLAMVLSFSAPAFAETTLEKINRTGVLTIGTRTGSPPLALGHNQKEWGGLFLRPGDSPLRLLI